MKKLSFSLLLLLFSLSSLSCNAQINAPDSPSSLGESTLAPEALPLLFFDWVPEDYALVSTGIYSQGQSISFLSKDNLAQSAAYYKQLIESEGFIIHESNYDPENLDKSNLLYFSAVSKDEKQKLHLILGQVDDAKGFHTKLDLSLGNPGQQKALSFSDITPALHPWIGADVILDSSDNYARSSAVSFYAKEALEVLILQYKDQLETEGFLIARESEESIIRQQKGWSCLAQKDGGDLQIDFMIMDLPEDSDFSFLPEAANHYSYVSIELYKAI